MNFRKRNYQRGKIKRHHQQELDSLMGKAAEAELKSLYNLFLNYEEEFLLKVGEFEKFIISKFNNSFFEEFYQHSLKQKVLERESDAHLAAKKMRELNISFEKKSFLGKLFETEQEELLRNQYYFASLHAKELREQLSRGSYAADFLCINGIEKFFISKFTAEIELELKKLHRIGVTIDYNSEKFSFGVSSEELRVAIANRFAFRNLKLKISYEQKYSLFLYDKIAVRDYFEEKFKKIKKRKEDRNLRALAAEKTDKQRSLASSNRTAKEYKNQIIIVDCCPYCGGELGGFNGESAAHFEHIHPVSKGGLSTIENTVFICAICNLKKSSMTLNAFILSTSLDRDAVFRRLSLLGKDF